MFLGFRESALMTLHRQAERSSAERDFNVLQQSRMATGATPPPSTTPQAPSPIGFTRQLLQLRSERGLGPKTWPCVRVKKRMLKSTTYMQTVQRASSSYLNSEIKGSPSEAFRTSL
ncbi:hypothetical protein ACET3Z_026251 [Daucus carota]